MLRLLSAGHEQIVFDVSGDPSVVIARPQSILWPSPETLQGTMTSHRRAATRPQATTDTVTAAMAWRLAPGGRPAGAFRRWLRTSQVDGSIHSRAESPTAVVHQGVQGAVTGHSPLHALVDDGGGRLCA